MNRTAGVSTVSGTTMWSSQTFSNMVFGEVLIKSRGEWGQAPFSQSRKWSQSPDYLTSAGYRDTRGIHVHVIEPAPLVLGLALHEREVGGLQLRRDRSALAITDLDGVHGADRGDFGGSTGEEQFVGQIQHLARHRDFAHLDSHAVSYTHLRAHETPEHLVCRLLLEKKK